MQEIRIAEDADQIREDIESIHSGWYEDESRVDWTDFLDRLEDYGYDMGESMDSPAIRRIKAIVRGIRRGA